MNDPLTAKQQRVYSFIRDFLNERGYPPTLNEIATAINVSAINTVVKYIKILEIKGYIYRSKHSKRGIMLKNDEITSPTIKVPVKASVGCDDLSVFENEKYDEFLEVDKKIVNGMQEVVAVRAVGNSMTDADIHDGDYVLIQVTNQANDGERVVAIVDDMVTVKKLEKRDNMIILRPESKDKSYRPIIMDKDFKIAGKVICTIPGESMDITDVVYDKNY